jgi:hypothetical protein
MASKRYSINKSGTQVSSVGAVLVSHVSPGLQVAYAPNGTATNNLIWHEPTFSDPYNTFSGGSGDGVWIRLTHSCADARLYDVVVVGDSLV